MKNYLYSVDNKEEFLLKICSMYYIIGMTQQEIADELMISRISVQKSLKEAKEKEIVEIRLHGKIETMRSREMERELVKIYELKDAVVIDTIQEQQYYSAAADYISYILPKKGNLILGGGNTLERLGKALHNVELSELNIIQGMGEIYGKNNNTAIVSDWACALHAHPYYFPVPGVMKEAESRQVMRRDSVMEITAELFQRADILVAGVGTYNSALRRTKDIIWLNRVLDSASDGAVGDILFHFYDENGEFCMKEISDRVTGLSVEEFYAVKLRILAACGEDKIEALRAALKGHLAHILITDRKTAESILYTQEWR